MTILDKLRPRLKHPTAPELYHYHQGAEFSAGVPSLVFEPQYGLPPEAVRGFTTPNAPKPFQPFGFFATPNQVVSGLPGYVTGGSMQLQQSFLLGKEKS